jgi:HEAT repeat protein
LSTAKKTRRCGKARFSGAGSRILKIDQEVRESAVFWSGQQNSQDALNFLIATADNDPSKQIREEAVFAISQINLAKNGKDQEVQEEAIFWLGQKASKQAEIALEDFAYNHEDYELQKSAVFALSQLSGDAGVPKLIQIAKTHPFPKIRKEAIFWLSQSDDPRALDTLVEIVQQR